MSSQKKLIILETSDIGAIHTAEAAKNLGFDPVFIVDLKNYQADILRQLRGYKVIDIPTDRAEAVFERIWEQRLNVGGVITFLDSRLRIAAELAKMLDVSGIDPTVIELKDKGYVAELVREKSPNSVYFHVDQIPHNSISEIYQSSPYGIVLKPTETAGAVGLHFVGPNTADLQQAVREKISSTQVPAFLAPGNWIAQEKRVGELVSLEGFVIRERIYFLGLTGRRKVGSTESQVIFPYDDQVSPVALAEAKDAVKTLVSRSGFKRGYFHIEFIISGEQAKLIDANMGRIGGGSLGEQLADSFDIEPVAVYEHVIAVTLGLPRPASALEQPAELRELRPTLGVLYGIKNRARLKSVQLPQSLKARHIQIIDNNQEIASMGLNNWSWVGILSGLTEDVRADIASIQIETDLGFEAPVY